MWRNINRRKERAKESREEWCDNRFPLLEKRLSREQCIAWMREKGYPDPPDSACVYCPFCSNARWAPDEDAKRLLNSPRPLIRA